MRLFAINLDRSADRRKALLGWLSRTRLPWEICSAVDASTMRPDTVPWTNEHWGEPLWPGVVGCFLSHLRMMQRVIDYDLSSAVIIEDDIAPLRVSDYPSQNPPPDFDVVYLHAMSEPGLAATIVERGDVFHRVAPAMLTTGAYIVSRKFAEKFCAAFTEVTMPIDHLFRKLSTEPDARFYQLAAPMFRIDGDFKSTIRE